jgi:hypothetical protein
MSILTGIFIFGLRPIYQTACADAGVVEIVHSERVPVAKRMNADDGDDPKFREYGSNWKCGLKRACP